MRALFPDEGQALNQPVVDLEALARSATPERSQIPVHASPVVRTVLYAWEPRSDRLPHCHRRATEVFLVLSGTVVFVLGKDEHVDCPEGTLLVVRRGLSHTFLVGGRAVVLVVISPNAHGDHEPPSEAELTAVSTNPKWSATKALFERPREAARSSALLADTEDLRVGLHIVPSAGQLVSHRHEGDELFLPLHGRMGFDRPAAEPHSLQRGWIAYAPRMSTHGVRANGPDVLALLTIVGHGASSAGTS